MVTISDLRSLIDEQWTPVEIRDCNGARSLNLNWIPMQWRIVSLSIYEESLLIRVDGDFNTL